jgi:hypothetical protein
MNDILRMVSGAPIKHRGGMGPVSGFASWAGKRGTGRRAGAAAEWWAGGLGR